MFDAGRLLLFGLTTLLVCCSGNFDYPQSGISHLRPICLSCGYNMLSAIRNIIRGGVTPRVVSSTCQFSTSNSLARGEDRKMMIASVPKRDEGTVGEKAIAIDSLITECVPAEGINRQLLFNTRFSFQFPHEGLSGRKHTQHTDQWPGF